MPNEATGRLDNICLFEVVGVFMEIIFHKDTLRNMLFFERMGSIRDN